MNLHHRPEYNTDKIKDGLKSHGMETDSPSQLSDAFRVGFIYAQQQCLKAISNIPTPKTEDMMSGHEDAYRAVEKI